MASLLPHTVLAYKPNGEVLVDGKPTALTEQRQEILQTVGGMVCKAGDLLALKKEQGREFVKDKRVVYLANVYSVLAIQTEDLAIRRGAGFELIGRAAQAETRGCSLMLSS